MEHKLKLNCLKKKANVLPNHNINQKLHRTNSEFNFSNCFMNSERKNQCMKMPVGYIRYKKNLFANKKKQNIDSEFTFNKNIKDIIKEKEEEPDKIDKKKTFQKDIKSNNISRNISTNKINILNKCKK